MTNIVIDLEPCWTFENNIRLWPLGHSQVSFNTTTQEINNLRKQTAGLGLVEDI